MPLLSKSSTTTKDSLKCQNTEDQELERRCKKCKTGDPIKDRFQNLESKECDGQFEVVHLVINKLKDKRNRKLKEKCVSLSDSSLGIIYHSLKLHKENFLAKLTLAVYNIHNFKLSK